MIPQRPRCCLLAPLVACLLFSPAGVRAAEPVRLGVVRGVVFGPDSDEPLAGVLVWSDYLDPVQTDSDGAFVLHLPPGRHVLKFTARDRPLGRTPPVAVVAGEVAEVVISLGSTGDAEAIVEDAGERAPAPVLDDRADWLTIEGSVLNADKRTPVAGARVFVRGQAVEGRTDAMGRFVLRLPPGVHVLTVVHPEYSTQTLPKVTVSRAPEGVEPEALRVELAPVAVELDDFVVTAPKLEGAVFAMLDERKASSAVSDVIGADQMSKAGDTDAASALKRVTGVTIVGGKFVYVRGMGERYSATLLNGLNLPSPEPERRVVPMDMFPVNMIESVVVQKTYSPDMPGEFGGGAVRVRTRGAPPALKATVELSTGYVSGTTFEKAQVPSDSGPTDWLGFDGGHRSLPGLVADATREGKIQAGTIFEPGLSPEQLEEISEAMPNRWAIERQTLMPDFKLNAAVGDRYELAERVDLGFMASLLYENAQDSEEVQRQTYALSGGELIPQNDLRFDTSLNEITLAGILALGLEIGEDHRITATGLVDRISENELRLYEGYSEDMDSQIRDRRLAWRERMLTSGQANGHHAFEAAWGLEVDWRYAYSRATRLEPDVRHTMDQFSEADEVWYLSQRPDGNGREYIDVVDGVHDAQLDLSLPFEQWSAEQAKVKVGAAMIAKDREVDIRRFSYDGVAKLDPEVRQLPPEEVFTADHIGPDGVVFDEFTRATDNYRGSQRIWAGFAMLDLPLGLGFRLSGGLRLEQSVQRVTTFELFAPEKTPIENTIDVIDPLPAATLSWKFTEDMLLRAGYGRTLNRPDFREMSPGCATTYAGGGEVCGAGVDDPDYELKRAVLHNFDLRWEWYPNLGETISVAFFFKQFEDPIESVLRSGSDVGTTYKNADAAVNLGLELDVRKGFGFILPALADLYLAGNFTWVYSRIELPEGGVQTSNKRALQGQSPYVFNVQVGYDNADTGTSLALLYNVFGKRIRDVGVLGQPDIFEQPFHQLDFVAKQSVGAGFKVGFKAKNIVDRPVRYTQGGNPTLHLKRGRAFSLSVSWSY